MHNQHGRLINEKLIGQEGGSHRELRDSKSYDDNSFYNSQTSQALSPTNFEGCVIMAINLVSLIWGLACIDFPELFSSNITRLNVFFLISMSTVLLALVASIALTVVLFLIGFIIGNPFRNSVYGCCPVFLFLFFYVEYGIIIHEGIKILTESKNHLTLAVTLYIIFQLIVGTLFYLVACYRMFCDKRMISPHLIELEKETYEIKESEIQDIRTEIQLAKQQKETEPKPDLETNLPIQVQRAV